MNARLYRWLAVSGFVAMASALTPAQLLAQPAQPPANNLRQFDANDPRNAPAQLREDQRREEQSRQYQANDNLRDNEGFAPAVQGPQRGNPAGQPAPIHGPTMPGQAGPNSAGPASARPPQQVLAPFRLTPEQERELDTNLIAWERQSGAIKTFKCEFTRWEYDMVFGPKDKPKVESSGELKYQSPDKGKFHVSKAFNYNPKTQKCDLKAGPDQLEHWVCDGQSIYEVNGKEETITERQLPPNLRGVAISDGPLPFVFGAKAASLKQKYWMRETTPPDVHDQLWLEAYPRVMSAAANFSKIEIILGRKDLMPIAIQMYDPGQNNQNRTVFQFTKQSVNGRFDTVFGDFVKPPTPPFYKKIVIPADGGGPQAGGNPGNANATGGNLPGAANGNGSASNSPARDSRATQAQRPTGQFR